MFHHGHLYPNEYHFRDYNKLVSYKRTGSITGKAKVSFTSHRLFIEFQTKRKLSQTKVYPFIIIDLLDISDYELTEYKLKLVSTKHEELYSYSSRKTVLERSEFIIERGDESIFGMLKGLILVTEFRKNNENESEFAAQIPDVVKLYESTSTELRVKMLDTRGIAIIQSAVVFKVDVYFRHRGLLVLSEESAFFFAFCKDTEFDFETIDLSTVVKVVKKPWRKYNSALEITTSTGVSLFIAFVSAQEREVVYNYLTSLPWITSQKLTDYTEQWRKRLISNYEYLLALNEESGRTKHDLSQYPIFPWVIQQYDSPTMDLVSPAMFRDLKLPIKNITEQKMQQVKAREEQEGVGTNHFADPQVVQRFLQKIYPQLHIPGQTQTNSITVLKSIQTEWNKAIHEESYFSELIPEFYSNNSQFLSNLSEVSAFTLPQWADSNVDFLLKMRAALESNIVSDALNHWIDLVFGVGQDFETNRYHDTSYEYVDEGIPTLYPNGVEYIAHTPLKIFYAAHQKRSPAVEDSLVQKKEESHKQELERLQYMIDDLMEQQRQKQEQPDETEQLKEQISVLNEQVAEGRRYIEDLNMLIDEKAQEAKEKPQKERESAMEAIVIPRRNASPNRKRIDNTIFDIGEKYAQLEARLQQSVKEKMNLSEQLLSLERKYKLMQQENRQLKINCHFLEQKLEGQTQLKERISKPLRDSTTELPESLIYANRSPPRRPIQPSNDPNGLFNRLSRAKNYSSNANKSPTRSINKSPTRSSTSSTASLSPKRMPGSLGVTRPTISSRGKTVHDNEPKILYMFN